MKSEESYDFCLASLAARLICSSSLKRAKKDEESAANFICLLFLHLIQLELLLWLLLLLFLCPCRALLMANNNGKWQVESEATEAAGAIRYKCILCAYLGAVCGPLPRFMSATY